jgi:hypothetical protein
MHRLICVVAWVALSAPSTVAEDPSKFSIARNGEGVTVTEGTSPVLTYQAKPRSLDGKWERADYVHPLYGLGGEVISEDFPEDHRHHRGVFWAWHQVWVGDQKLGDAWTCKDFRWDVQAVEATVSSDFATIEARTHWKSPDLVDGQHNPLAILEEQCEIKVFPRQPHYRVIDFRLVMTALVDDLRIGGSEDEKGYGGFSPRIRLEGDEQFLSANATLEPTITAIEAGTWVNISRAKSGVAILVHRDNPGVSEEGADWILRRGRSMQNAVFPGRNPVAISTITPTVLRYRLVIHDGTLIPEAINRLQEDFWMSAR